MLPPELAPALDKIGKRRCAGCHAGGRVPRAFYTRMLEPENNSFLLAPLAREAGGTEACGTAVFTSREDPDYQAILKTFDPIQKMIKDVPREDMVPGGK